MAWIEVHTNLPDNPKVLRAAKALKIDSDALVGKLVRLWTWALENRENGILTDVDMERLGRIMNYSGKVDLLSATLIEYGLLEDEGEGCASIHDWDEHVVRLLEKKREKRKQTAERVARYRSKNKDANNKGCNALQGRYETRTCNACNPPTVPNPTLPLPDPTNIDIMTDTISVPYARAQGELSTACGKLAEQIKGAWMHVLATVPSEDEVKTVLRHSVGMDISAVKYALELTCLYGATNPAAYAAKTLSEWNTLGITTEDAARAWREAQEA